MGLKYVLKSMQRRKLRTLIIALALTVGVALVGALLSLVDTQRQFSIQAVGAQTGGYDLSISKNDLAASTFFDIAQAEALSVNAYNKIAAMHPRIQASVEGRKVNALDGQAVTFIAIDAATDNLVSLAQTDASATSGSINILGIRIGGNGVTVGGGGRGGQGGPGGPGGGFPAGGGAAPGGRGQGTNAAGNGQASRFGSRTGGTFPPESGQVYLDSTTAGTLGAQVGDEILLSYALLTPREVGTTAITGTSTPRVEAQFTVAGVGVLNGLSGVSNPIIIRLDDAQKWLGASSQANQLLLVWQSGANGSSDPRATVTQARDVGEQVRAELQSQLGPDYVVSLPKYTSLENSAQSYTSTQTYITLYGLLSMGIVGLMVNALMMTTVTEQKYDLAILRVLGSPRSQMYSIVIIEVALLGLIGIVFGLVLGRVINDRVMVPLLLANLDLPAGVRADWTLQTVMIPTGITIVVLALATINPARTAAATKVMVVLNPAAADQPTLEDLSKLRERRADTGLLVVGLVLLAFSGVILIALPTIFTPGNASGQALVNSGSLLLMVIGIALLFYFLTTPLERVLVILYRVVSPTAAFFAGRYALRGKGRNALISLMVVMSGVLPCLLATQLALQDANLETDARFSNGAPLIAQVRARGDNFQIFNRTSRRQANLSDTDVAAITSQPGVGIVVGVADGLSNMTVSDQIGLRSARVNLLGVQGDLNNVLYPDLYRWIEGNATALTRVNAERDIAVISQGLSEALDLHVGDTLVAKGAGNDHTQPLTIIGVAARIPGFTRYFTRNRSDANGSGVFINLETYRELQNNPSVGAPDLTAPLLTQLMATLQPGVNENFLLVSLRNYLGNQNDMNVVATSEQVALARAGLQQSRIPIILLTGLSMVTAIFGVLAVMYSAVMGRRVEIGMLKAVGASKGSLRGVFIGEAVITTLAAGVAGIIAGTILGYVFEFSRRLQGDQPLLLAFDFNTAGVIIALVCISAVFSAVLATQPVIRQRAIKILRER